MYWSSAGLGPQGRSRAVNQSPASSSVAPIRATANSAWNPKAHHDQHDPERVDRAPWAGVDTADDVCEQVAGEHEVRCHQQVLVWPRSDCSKSEE